MEKLKEIIYHIWLSIRFNNLIAGHKKFNKKTSKVNIFKHILHPLSDLSWKTEIWRTDKFSLGCLSIRLSIPKLLVLYMFHCQGMMVCKCSLSSLFPFFLFAIFFFFWELFFYFSWCLFWAIALVSLHFMHPFSV